MDIRHYNDWVQIGLNILHYRKEQRLTQEQLAEMRRGSQPQPHSARGERDRGMQRRPAHRHRQGLEHSTLQAL